MGPRLVCPGNRSFHDLNDTLLKKKSKVHSNDYGVSQRRHLSEIIYQRAKEGEQRGHAQFQKVKPDVILHGRIRLGPQPYAGRRLSIAKESSLEVRPHGCNSLIF